MRVTKTQRKIVTIIYNKLIKFTGIFYKLRTKLSITWLKAVYCASVHPQIVYNIHNLWMHRSTIYSYIQYKGLILYIHCIYSINLYANTCLTYLQKLVKLTNKIYRILLYQFEFIRILLISLSYMWLYISSFIRFESFQLCLLEYEHSSDVKLLAVENFVAVFCNT